VSSPLGLLFAAMLGMYILLISFRTDWRLSIAGAILYGLSTTHMILMEAGHVNKMLVLAFLPPTLAGIMQIYKGKYLRGAAATAIFTCMQVMANHLQITYYFFILIALYGIFALVEAVRNGAIKGFVMASAIAAASVVLGIMPNVAKLWTTLDYSQECIRGKSDLKPLKDEPAKADDGLTKDYAFGQWSLGKMETFSLLIPNFMGGDAAQSFAITEEGQLEPKYRFIQSIKDPNMQQEVAQAASHYWGAQSFVSGAWYYGAALILLFFLGFFTLRGAMKWWSLASLGLIFMIAWGQNLAGFNFFLFDHFPMFNKFRDPKMIIGIGHILIVSMGIFGLQRYLSDDLTKEEKQKAIYSALATVGGLIAFAILYGMTATLVGPSDAIFEAQYPEFIRTLRADRADLLTSDAYRSLMFVLLVGGLLWAHNRYGINKLAVVAGVIALALFDVIGVDKRYLASDKFQEPRTLKAAATARPVDTQIMADKELSFRVVDFSRGGNPFANALPSYFHKSIGGYHAAKLMIFQDLVDRYLSNPNEAMHLYGMLNTKYIITSGQNNQPQAMKLPEQCGNAWFVKSFKVVKDANEEMDSLKNLKPKESAVLQEKFAKNIAGMNIQYDSLNFIKLEKYVPDRLTYKFKANSEQLAMFSEVYYPQEKGWKVTINGQPADLMRANYLLRAVKIPQGEGTIEMVFEPKSYYTGQTIARIGSILLTLLFAGALYLYFKKEDEVEESVAGLKSL
jgi:Bacterial membrane protein YfhO